MGKTAILRWLELDGYGVVEEAATDVIALQQAQGVAEPWTRAWFIDSIVNLQHERQFRAARLGDHKQFFDRSPICTYALAKYPGYPISAALSTEIDRIEQEGTYQKRVFFVLVSALLPLPTSAGSRPKTRCDLSGSMRRAIASSITRSYR